MEIRSPEKIPKYAALCLNALSSHGLGHYISLGGAFGLMHYFEYRPTADVDAWWQPDCTSDVQKQVIEVLEGVLQAHGSVRTRRWGDVASVELLDGTKKAFSFQIARRSAQLSAGNPSPWGDIRLDSFDDLVANKMVALVERGAPRDFLDIFTLCEQNLVTVHQCWRLWEQRQTLADAGTNFDRARLGILSHLARIEQHRPLDTITDPASRANAARVRQWFKTEFYHGSSLA